jgi:cytidine deaminase
MSGAVAHVRRPRAQSAKDTPEAKTHSKPLFPPAPSKSMKNPKRTKPNKASATDRALLDAALAARLRAHAPYSKFQVGAALRAKDGRVFTGCNVENSSYGLSICAERVAMTKAVSEGVRDFVDIAIVTQSARPSPPCGACRQFLAELAPELRVLLGNTHGDSEATTLRALLPHAFDRNYL